MGPAEKAAWVDVADVAERSGELLGSPDYLDRSRQLTMALELLAASWQRPLATPQLKQARTLTKRQRFRTGTRRWRTGQASFVSYLRTCAWIIFKSHRAQPSARPEPPTAPAASDAVSRVQELLRAQHYDHAYVLAKSLVADASDVRLLDLVARVQSKRGSVSAVLALRRRIYELQKKRSDIGILKLEGRFRELTGWVPSLPGPRVQIVPAADNIVLHLVKESRPYVSNGFTSRSHRNFVAEQAAGLEPVVLTEPGFPRRNGIEDFDAVQVVDGITHHRLDVGPLELQEEPSDAWLERFATMALARVEEIRPAVIHASSGRRGYETALVGLALKEKTGLPLVYEVRSFFEANWTADVAWEEHGETYLRRRAVEIMCMERADAVITLGEAMRDEIIRSGIAPEKVFIVPNGVDLDDFNSLERNEDLAQKFGLTGKPTFGYVSNMDHYRESQETLIQACAILKARGSEMHCVLVGGGPRTGAMKKLALQLQVSDRVVFTGPVDHTEIPAYYSLIDLFVVPRIDERAARFVTPLKPFEAMAVGRPVVVSDLPALREIVDPPHRGLTFEPGDAESLADVITDCERDPEKPAALAKAGYEWVVRERQWSQNGARYRSVFDGVIAQWKSEHAG